jgi:predicted nucleic acid-binding protein
MICVDTTFLVDLWRDRDLPDCRSRNLLTTHPGEVFAVPAHAAGEFLEGGAAVSQERLEQSLAFLRLFRIGEVGIETAHRYAVIVAGLRKESRLVGRSKPDLWVAAWAVQNGAPLATRNTRRFRGIPGLELIEYPGT